eukprot:TRINITY_DN355_c0_g4_i3.p1 TRINITY_DN355_c0_g4~~TRINITY_DN355_c0_g4_i3.p1  ORF type:complete len:376 (+),score=86.51 TRINITY_DN355_c0_g4_i3:331-1458(+)
MSADGMTSPPKRPPKELVPAKRPSLDHVIGTLQKGLKIGPKSNLTSITFSGAYLLAHLRKVYSLTKDACLVTAHNLVTAEMLCPVNEFERSFFSTSLYTFAYVREKVPRYIKCRNLKSASSSPDLIDLHPLEVARQLTLIEHGMFVMIDPTNEMHKNAWKGADRMKNAPCVCALIDWFNKMTRWVATEVVSSPNIRQRTAVLSRFISLAQSCRKLRNYNTLMQIVSGLNMTPVSRLKRTWKALKASDTAAFEDLSELMNNLQNFKNYRQELASAPTPVMPYFGLVVQDIMNGEELVKMSKQKLKEDGLHGQIPLRPLTKLSHNFVHVLTLQRARYPIEEYPQLQDHLKRAVGMALSDDMLYDRSKQCEGRGGKMV